eukprot:gene13290-13401_t
MDNTGTPTVPSVEPAAKVQQQAGMSAPLCDAPLTCDSLKRQQILNGAREIFMRDGFDGASMNDITRAAAVSKGTVYAYFRSKEILFETLIREDRRQYLERILRMDWTNPDLSVVLFDLGMELVQIISNTAMLSQLRTIIAVAVKFPNLGAAFFEAGPLAGKTHLAQYFDRLNETGRLKIADTTLAAGQFIELCRCDLTMKALLNLQSMPSQSEMEYHVRSAVDVFLKAYQN